MCDWTVCDWTRCDWTVCDAQEDCVFRREEHVRQGDEQCPGDCSVRVMNRVLVTAALDDEAWMAEGCR